ncbi:hypothetical protein XV03_24655, partial [Mycobacterium avium subsp. hominissuis]
AVTTAGPTGPAAAGPRGSGPRRAARAADTAGARGHVARRRAGPRRTRAGRSGTRHRARDGPIDRLGRRERVVADPRRAGGGLG